jgi:hypothetical protein
MPNGLGDDAAWTGRGKVRAREDEAGLVIVVDGLTSQAKYYKPLIYEFFRKEWRASRPAWGEYAVEIRMEYTGDPPWLDDQGLRLPRRRPGRAPPGRAPSRRARAHHGDGAGAAGAVTARRSLTGQSADHCSAMWRAAMAEQRSCQEVGGSSDLSFGLLALHHGMIEPRRIAPPQTCRC